MEVNIKLDNLRKRLLELENVAIAYSGGVDSNFLLKVAKDILKDKVIFYLKWRAMNLGKM